MTVISIRRSRVKTARKDCILKAFPNPQTLWRCNLYTKQSRLTMYMSFWMKLCTQCSSHPRTSLASLCSQWTPFHPRLSLACLYALRFLSLSSQCVSSLPFPNAIPFFAWATVCSFATVSGYLGHLQLWISKNKPTVHMCTGMCADMFAYERDYYGMSQVMVRCLN